VEAETEFFLNTLAPLGRRLGPLFLQLPPSFGPEELPALEHYLGWLSHEFRYAVEVRHPEFFESTEARAALNGLLASLNVARVIFDTRPLFASSATDAHTREAQRKKPQLPVHVVATSTSPFVRYVAHPELEANVSWLEGWAEAVEKWIREGRTPHFFVHAPNDFYAPRLARLFHRLLSERVDVATMPVWPAEEEEPPVEQLSLF
jgi:uncharacterized protein YecE (DUF72 family)